MDEDEWLRALPKAELHLHIEGTLEPDLMFALARRNSVTLRFANIDEARAAYRFADLQGFLDLYHAGMSVLRAAADFHDLAIAYFERAHADGVVHADVSFDPQAHVARGVPLGDVIAGLRQAAREAMERFGLSSSLVMSFLRDHDPADASRVFAAAAPFYHELAAVGLDNAEVGHPPGQFRDVYARARAAGLAATAHAGEEGPPAYISEAIDVLHVDRIDHGVRCVEDSALVSRLRALQIPITVCPLSNVNLHVAERLEEHPLPQMLEQGLNVSINSDDPAYLGGGIMANFRACRAVFGWDRAVCRQLAANSINAAFVPAGRRRELLADVLQR